MLVPVDAEPGWLQAVSKVLPLTCAVDALREMMLKGADLASASLQLDLAVIGACCVPRIVAATATLRRALMRALDAIAPATGRRFDLEIVTAESASRATRRPTVELYYGAAHAENRRRRPSTEPRGRVLSMS